MAYQLIFSGYNDQNIFYSYSNFLTYWANLTFYSLLMVILKSKKLRDTLILKLIADSNSAY